jgi:low affinity Fe/Cu permease
MAATKQHWTTRVGQAAGHPAAFAVVILYAVLWFYFDKATFDWNAVATLAVWGMTLFIQRSNRRDTLALHSKLDELLRVDSDARTELTRRDEQEPEAIQKHRDIEVQRIPAHGDRKSKLPPRKSAGQLSGSEPAVALDPSILHRPGPATKNNRKMKQ